MSLAKPKTKITAKTNTFDGYFLTEIAPDSTVGTIAGNNNINTADAPVYNILLYLEFERIINKTIVNAIA